MNLNDLGAICDDQLTKGYHNNMLALAVISNSQLALWWSPDRCTGAQLRYYRFSEKTIGFGTWQPGQIPANPGMSLVL